MVPDLAGASFATVLVADAMPPSPLVHDPIELIVGRLTLRLDAATDTRRVAELVAALQASL